MKLFREHGRTTPVGFALDATETPEALTMSFHVGATPDGDRALLEASEGIRDGAVGRALVNVEIRDGVVLSADLAGVALVAVPAFPEARCSPPPTPPTPTPTPPTPLPRPRAPRPRPRSTPRSRSRSTSRSARRPRPARRPSRPGRTPLDETLETEGETVTEDTATPDPQPESETTVIP